MIGSHLVQTCPCAFGIDCEVLKHWDPVGGASQNLFNEVGIEISFVSQCFFRIVPRQQKCQAFGSKVKAIRYVNDHGGAVRKVVKWLGGFQHWEWWIDR